MLRTRFPYVLAAAIIMLFTGAPAQALSRPMDPVILTGADLPELPGIAPGELVAFRWSGDWEQIPVQVDERAVINFTSVYNGNRTYGNLSRLDYVDSGTFTGPDPNPLLDADDEIVFMAADSGEKCPSYFRPPAGARLEPCIEVTLTDPLGGAPGHVYLFVRNGTLDPSAGVFYVDYDFGLLSGDYKSTYKLAKGPNPENTTITTDFYRRHFSDRWKYDGLNIFAGGATGVDILDRHKNLFAPGYCGRSENTFSAAEGAFIINKNGPVRAIRGYVGANSGPRTQRTHHYYAQREDITTHLRVHSIPAIMDFLDYSPAAAGMTYHNNNAPSGVVIDGVPDTVAPGRLQWELVTGPQGSLAMLLNFITDMPTLNATTYYLDNINPPETQCTGDAFAYGSSGTFIIQSIPNTDPAGGAFNILQVLRTMYYLPPNTTTEQVEALNNANDHPLEVTVSIVEPVPVPLPLGWLWALAALLLLAGAGFLKGAVIGFGKTKISD